MKKLRFIAVFLAMIAIVCSFAGCSDKQKYNARLDIIPRSLIRPEFEKENKVCAYYPDENYSEGEDIPSYIYYKDEPSSRTFIIRDKETYDNVFTDESLLVDFGKETIILHIIVKTNARKVLLDKVTVKDDRVSIAFKEEKYRDGIQDSIMTGPAYLVIKIEKTDIRKVEFIDKRR